MSGHKHAHLMALYAQDAAETDEPWLRWEVGHEDGAWVSCPCNPSWRADTKFRSKPKTININGFEVPEPYQGEMKANQPYWLADITSTEALFRIWHGYICDDRWRKVGLIHLTKEAAELHRKALLSFTEVKE